MGTKRTFKGFLKAYCTELSGMRTTSLRRLCHAAQDNARLVEPLFVLAAEEGQARYLTQLAQGTWFYEEYARLAPLLDGDTLKLLESGAAPARYAAVAQAYRGQHDLLAADRRINALLRPKILRGLADAGTTRYRMCADLGLNRGNVYAYLAGDDAKVSRETARRMAAYVESLNA